MNKQNANITDERRQYFRTQGVVYLMIQSPEEFKKTSGQHDIFPPTMDLLEIELMHFKSLLSYDKPPNSENTTKLAEFVQQLHQTYKRILANPDDRLTLLSKKIVIISGGGIDFISDSDHKVGDDLYLTIAFPEYPFATVKIQGEVLRCEPCSESSTRRRICILFKNISDHNRDVVIKFVNYLQRKDKLYNSAGKKSDMINPSPAKTY